MRSQAQGVAVDASLARGNVRQSPGRRHVARLALLPLAARRACQPFGIGRVNGHPENDPFVTGGAVAAVAIQGTIRKRFAGALRVIKGPKEKLPPRGSQKSVPESAERQAALIDRGTRNLVAIIALDAPFLHSLHLGEICESRVSG